MGHYHLLGIFHGGMVDGPLNDQKNMWVGKTPRKSAKRVQSTRKYVNIEMLRFQSMALRAFWSLCLSSTSICITNKLKPLNNFKNQMQYRLKKTASKTFRDFRISQCQMEKKTPPRPHLSFSPIAVQTTWGFLVASPYNLRPQNWGLKQFRAHLSHCPERKNINLAIETLHWMWCTAWTSRK